MNKTIEIYKISFTAIINHEILGEETKTGEVILLSRPTDIEMWREASAFSNSLTGKIDTLKIDITSKTFEWEEK